ncbi:MAG: DeoR/GlpR family DNA-binding transcription regulator [Oscillospiraceae bacterium]
MNERQQRILTLLGDQRELSVAHLSQLLEISQVTVRKDIDVLVAEGYATRRHGSVLAVSGENIAGRLLRSYEEKLEIAKRAASLVRDGDTVLIESGSTCAILGKLLAKQKRNLTIVTNSFFIADFIREFTEVKTILLGGEFQPEAKVAVGPLTALCLQQFYGKYLFCGVDGLSPQWGFTLSDPMRADTVVHMAKSAQETCVLTTSEKFRQRGTATQLPFSQVSRLFTDSGISQEEQLFFEEKGISVCLPRP